MDIPHTPGPTLPPISMVIDLCPSSTATQSTVAFADPPLPQPAGCWLYNQHVTVPHSPAVHSPAVSIHSLLMDPVDDPVPPPAREPSPDWPDPEGGVDTQSTMPEAEVLLGSQIDQNTVPNETPLGFRMEPVSEDLLSEPYDRLPGDNSCSKEMLLLMIRTCLNHVGLYVPGKIKDMIKTCQRYINANRPDNDRAIKDLARWIRRVISRRVEEDRRAAKATGYVAEVSEFTQLLDLFKAEAFTNNKRLRESMLTAEECQIYETPAQRTQDNMLRVMSQRVADPVATISQPSTPGPVNNPAVQTPASSGAPATPVVDSPPPLPLEGTIVTTRRRLDFESEKIKVQLSARKDMMVEVLQPAFASLEAIANRQSGLTATAERRLIRRIDAADERATKRMKVMHQKTVRDIKSGVFSVLQRFFPHTPVDPSPLSQSLDFDEDAGFEFDDELLADLDAPITGNIPGGDNSQYSDDTVSVDEENEV